jgi:glutamate synthase domain-containing protein 2/glutamate synthase domain-containing protein 1/glutamate synthase domain-containing protein 3
MKYSHFPKKQGLYDPAYEKDACGVGFVCHIKGKKSNTLVKNALTILKRLEHRGAVGADPKTGDGAGILIQMPHDFFQSVCSFEIPKIGQYGTGLMFFPRDAKERAHCKHVFKQSASEEGLKILGWRKVPLNNKVIGKTAKQTEPVIEQPFLVSSTHNENELALERKLYVVRKYTETLIRNSELKQKSFFYITNLSCRTFAFKGLLMTAQLEEFFLDLKNTKIKSALALVHSRYSTNTFPTWDLAQPFRYLAHNGEINTLRGNVNWMRAREGLLQSDIFGTNIDKIKPIIVPDLSDSASLDNAIEFLILSGRSLFHSLMMLVPPAWEQNDQLDEKLRDFYKYHTCFMEPWDGPAAIAVTDGTNVGAVLDRNGLRPARYLVTKNDFVVMSSEVGVLNIKPSEIAMSGRIEPGKIFFIDTVKGEIINDETIKRNVSSQKPYSTWVKKNLVEFESLPHIKKQQKLSEPLDVLLKAFDYTREDLREIITPMSAEAMEPTGAMGCDFPHAILSHKHQLLYNYFKQLFAQVTNPAIDPIREEIVMSLESFVGPQKNILEETPEHCHKIHLKEPILLDEELQRFAFLNERELKTTTISLLFNVNDKKSFKQRIKEMCTEAKQAIDNGFTFIILSDRGVTKDKAALPALLATGAVHHFLIKNALRTQVGIIVESAEPREVHHFATLFGYGADCVNPYLAYAAINDLTKKQEIDLPIEKALLNYRKAINKGLLKIMSKMGISTLHSYRGAQIFEAIGLNDDVIKISFKGTASRIGGATLDIITQETIQRHAEAYPDGQGSPVALSSGGIYQWKRDGEFHLWNPDTIAAIQEAARKNDYGKYLDFAKMINDQSQNPTTLRSLLKFKKTTPITLDEVEPIESILKRFATGAMSFGSISKGAHETLAIAMNRIGGRSNTGEGGEDPMRFKPLPNGDSARSSIKQVASGRFGVSANYLTNADEIQIKIAQGAKPGEGGQLPGHKVSEIIARTRFTTPGVTLISPPPHHDIYSIEDLAQLIFDLKNINPRARISVKLVSEVGVGTIAAGVAKGHADMILISGGDGGTGASPRTSIRHAGLPWELGLSETHQTLVLNDLRSRVRLQTDGQMRTGRDVAIASLLGAEEYGFCTVTLIVMGCVMLRHCHLNNCSVGVATQDDLLQKRFCGNPDHVVNYMYFVARELREIMAQLGIRTMNEMIGRTDLLEVNKAILPWKANKIDFSKILYKPTVTKNVSVYKTIEQKHEIDSILDLKLIKQAHAAIHHHEKVTIEMPIENINRTTGATLSGNVCLHNGENGLPENTLHCKFTGVAGQSFGAFLAKGISFELEGLANDYVGKALSGGRIVIYPGKKAAYVPEDNVLIGNTTFYGAITGEAYIRGKAGERFCIRNSGVYAVAEGVGDHGCEYMTGGRALILGKTGRNFGAGMSGGIAYIYDQDKSFKKNCNMSMVELENLDESDVGTIQIMLHNHALYTHSTVAQIFLENFTTEIKKIVKVLPTEYKRILELSKVAKKLGVNEVSDGW